MEKLILISSLLLSTQVLAGPLEPVYNVLVKSHNQDKVTIGFDYSRITSFLDLCPYKTQLQKRCSTFQGKTIAELKIKVNNVCSLKVGEASTSRKSLTIDLDNICEKTTTDIIQVNGEQIYPTEIKTNIVDVSYKFNPHTYDYVGVIWSSENSRGKDHCKAEEQYSESCEDESGNKVLKITWKQVSTCENIRRKYGIPTYSKRNLLDSKACGDDRPYKVTINNKEIWHAQ